MTSHNHISSCTSAREDEESDRPSTFIRFAQPSQKERGTSPPNRLGCKLLARMHPASPKGQQPFDTIVIFRQALAGLLVLAVEEHHLRQQYSMGAETVCRSLTKSAAPFKRAGAEHCLAVVASFLLASEAEAALPAAAGAVLR
jgi:hypothetical protein